MWWWVIGWGCEAEEWLCQCQEPVHMNHDRNQSINPPTSSQAGRQWCKAPPDLPPHCRGQKKLAIFSRSDVCSPLRLTARKIPNREKERNDSDATTGVATSDKDPVDYHTCRDACSERHVSRGGSAGSSHQRQIEWRQRQRQRRLS